MPKNVIKENLNIESIEKTGEVLVLPQNKSYILSIKDYSIIVATLLLISQLVLFLIFLVMLYFIN